MIFIAGGVFRIGSNEHYDEERPSRCVEVEAFCIDETPVTNEAFALFVAETSWVTCAERGVAPASSVFEMTSGPVNLTDPDQWWHLKSGAQWRAPEGAGSSIEGRSIHPVVHIAKEDAEAFASWRGARLATETEWEVAARGGLKDASYAWGNTFSPTGTLMANVWEGAFPWYFARDGSPGTSAVETFPPNGHGLYDMIGNVWEWTASSFVDNPKCACSAGEAGADKNYALKGGSFLCAGEYCLRYRPAARIGVRPGATTSHIGFRCAKDA